MQWFCGKDDKGRIYLQENHQETMATITAVDAAASATSNRIQMNNALMMTMIDSANSNRLIRSIRPKEETDEVGIDLSSRVFSTFFSFAAVVVAMLKSLSIFIIFFLIENEKKHDRISPMKMKIINVSKLINR